MTNEKNLYSVAKWAIFNPISLHNNPRGFIGETEHPHHRQFIVMNCTVFLGRTLLLLTILAIHLRRDTDGYGYSTVTRPYAELTRPNTGCSFKTATITVAA